MRKFFLILTILCFCFCTNKNTFKEKKIDFSYNDAYAKWIFYCANFQFEKACVFSLNTELQELKNYCLLKENIISIKYIIEDTLVYRFYITNLDGMIEPRGWWCPWVIIQNKSGDLLGLMGEYAILEDYSKCINNFHEFNLSQEAKYTPSGIRSQFPIENSIVEFENSLEEKKNLKKINPWLYYYFHYIYKKDKQVWNEEIQNEVYWIVDNEKSRNPIITYTLK